MYEVIKKLRQAGHNIQVVDHGRYSSYQFEGEIIHGKTKRDQVKRWPDIFVTHLGATSWTQKAAKGKPVAYFIQVNNKNLIPNGGNSRVIYNTEWIRHESPTRSPNMVFNPPLREMKPTQKNPKYITLINLCENKGGNIFYELARIMPEYQFLGVKGGYGHQIVQNLPNISILPNGQDMAKIYTQSKVIIMPSNKETYGMVATEAMSLGIPVICTPTKGLSENCKDYAHYVQRDDIEGWVKAIRQATPKTPVIKKSNWPELIRFVSWQ